jgi:hypothetical protein
LTAGAVPKGLIGGAVERWQPDRAIAAQQQRPQTSLAFCRAIITPRRSANISGRILIKLLKFSTTTFRAVDERAKKGCGDLPAL